MSSESAPYSNLARTAADLPVPGTQYGSLQMILRLFARDGYVWFFLGYMPLLRALLVVDRLHSKHNVLLSPTEQAAVRRAGLVVARVVMNSRVVNIDGEERVPFALLSTGPLKGERQYRISDEDTRGRDRRLVWMDRYVLQRRPSGAWTWHLTEELFADYARQIGFAADAGDARRLHGLLSGLAAMPLFHGVSADVTKLMRLASSRWAHRTRRHAGPTAAPSLYVKDYLQAARPRRGVGGRVYVRSKAGDLLTLRDLVGTRLDEQQIAAQLRGSA